MSVENRHRFDRQIKRRQQELDEDLILLGERRLQLQSLLISQPDPVPRRQWAKKAHNKADARLPTANELGERRQRQENRQQAHLARIHQEEEAYITEILNNDQENIHTPEPFNS